MQISETKGPWRSASGSLSETGSQRHDEPLPLTISTPLVPREGLQQLTHGPNLWIRPLGLRSDEPQSSKLSNLHHLKLQTCALRSTAYKELQHAVAATSSEVRASQP